MNRFAGLLILVLFGCDGGRPGSGRTDSESHWLEPCTSDAECGELACICGMCARACTPADGVCADLGADATCLALPAACGGVTACTRPCDQASACGADHLTCEGGACHTGAAPLDGGTDANIPRDMASLDMSVDMARPADMSPADMSPVDMSPVDMAPDMAPADIIRLPEGPGCLGDGDCPAGRCQAEGLDAQNQRCGAPEPAANVCQPEACIEDADCGLARRCVRAGEFGFVRSACVPARCAQDADCADRPAGECLGFFSPCHTGGFACVGTGDTCRVDADCPQRGAVRVCLPRAAGGTECVAIE